MKLHHNDERVSQTTATLAEQARAAGMTTTADGRVSDTDAASLIGIAPGTLKNLRALGTGPAFFRLGVGGGSRVSYRLADLAYWIEYNREEALP